MKGVGVTPALPWAPGVASSNLAAPTSPFIRAHHHIGENRTPVARRQRGDALSDFSNGKHSRCADRRLLRPHFSPRRPLHPSFRVLALDTKLIGRFSAGGGGTCSCLRIRRMLSRSLSCLPTFRSIASILRARSRLSPTSDGVAQTRAPPGCLPGRPGGSSERWPASRLSAR